MGNTKRNDTITHSRGAGCAGDPPNFPTYRYEVVTDLRRKPENRGMMAISSAAEEDNDWLSAETRRQARRMIADWHASKLPLEHPRTRLWIMRTYQHFKNCYQHPTELEYGRPATVIYPVPYYKLPAPREFKDDPRFSDGWREAERASIAAANVTIQAERDAIIEATAAFCTPDNHLAVRTIRKFYPEYEPELDLIENPPQLLQADWWETLETPPSSNEECKRTCRTGIRSEHADVDANRGNLWCRWCGYGLTDDYSATVES